MEPFNRKELKNRAKLNLKQHFWMACLICLVGILLGGSWTGMKQGGTPVNLTRIFSTSSRSSDAARQLKEILRGDTTTDPSEYDSYTEDILSDDYSESSLSDDAPEMERFLDTLANSIRNTEDGAGFYYVYDPDLSESDNLQEFFHSYINYMGVEDNDIAAVLLIILGLVLLLLVGIWILSTIFRFLVGSFLGAPVRVGMCNYFLISHNRKGNIDDLFYSFSRGRYMNVIKTMFSMNIRIFGWSLLFYFPGLVKTYEYYFVPYLMAEHPEMSAKEARSASRQMTDGIKWNIFVLEMSFLGWVFLFILEELLLAVCSFGLLAIPGLLLIFPLHAYQQATYAELYLSRSSHLRQDPVSEEDVLASYPSFNE